MLQPVVKISLFIPCFVDQLFPQVGISVVEVLERLGHEVDFPSQQTCCGQPAFNAGHWQDAKEVASRFIDVFHDAEVIVSPSGSCTSMVKKFYGELFKDSLSEEHKKVSEKTFEFTEFLVKKLGVRDVGATFNKRVTWHDGCHALRELHLKQEPRELLRSVRGLQLIETSECETCCGFGGTFSVKFPDISVAMDEVKVASIEASGAECVVSSDSSCLMQIKGLLEKRSSPIQTYHIAEVLASRT
jgi:L-lactate dehydrogenase complex protein LldE